jgi:hypothetical protein
MPKSRKAQHEQGRGFGCFSAKLGLGSPYLQRLSKAQGRSKAFEGERSGKSRQTTTETKRIVDAGRSHHLLEALPKEGDFRGVREWICATTDCGSEV